MLEVFAKQIKKKIRITILQTKKYLHFVGDKYNLLFSNMTKGKFICTYEFPDEIIKSKIVYAKYLDLVTEDFVPVTEYAIESDMISFDNLVKVDKIVKDINLQDFFFNETLKNLVEGFYDKKMRMN